MSEQHKPSDIVPRPQSGTLSLLDGGRAETAKALVAAVNACHAVEKSDRNEFHKYNYASADTIIAEGRRALASAGLALIPVKSELNGFQREGPDRFELIRTFALIHSSGEVTPLQVCWPVTPEKGRPLDKAAAIADTLSLSYLLRDLLLMNRVDPSDDLNTHDDRPQQQPAKRQTAPEKKAPPADGAELLARLRKKEAQLVAEKRCEAGDLVLYVQSQGVSLGHPPEIAQWGPEPIKLASDWVRTFLALHSEPQVNGKPARPTPPEKAKALQDLMVRKKVPWNEGKGNVCSIFDLPKTTMVGDLTPLQYQQIYKAVSEEPDRN